MKPTLLSVICKILDLDFVSWHKQILYDLLFFVFEIYIVYVTAGDIFDIFMFVYFWVTFS
jgi:hypothetical protein